jgi:hypothetical protein
MHSGCPCSSSGWPPCKCGSPPSPWCRKSWHHMWHNPRTHCGCQWLHMSFRLNLTGHHSHCLILSSLVFTMMTPAELNWWLPGVLVHGAAGHVKGEQRSACRCPRCLLNWPGFLRTVASYQTGFLRMVERKTGHHSHCLILGSLVLTMMTPAELNWWLPGVFVHGDAGHVKGEQRKCVPLSTLPAQLDWLPQASCVFSNI